MSQLQSECDRGNERGKQEGGEREKPGVNGGCQERGRGTERERNKGMTERDGTEMEKHYADTSPALA